MPTLADLEPGMIGFGPIPGRGGLIVGAGELLVAPFDHWASWREWIRVRHCGTITRAASPGFRLRTSHILGQGGASGVGPRFAQAEPSGYEEIEMTPDQFWTPEWIYIKPRWRTLDQGRTVADIARRMAEKKIPYGFEDYAAIAGHRMGLHSKGLDDFISRTDGDGDPQRAICSQGVDAQLTLSGGLTADGHVFNDKRLPQDVTPSEMLLLLLSMEPAAVFRPGQP